MYGTGEKVARTRLDVILHIPRTGLSYLRGILAEQCPLAGRWYCQYGFRLLTPMVYYLIVDKPSPVLQSHYAFGITDERLDVHYHTLLRNPLDRIISEHAHVQRDDKNPLNQAAKTASVVDFASRLRPANVVCRSLLGQDGRYFSGEIGEKEFVESLRRLHSFDTVGAFEDYETSAAMLGVNLNLRLEVQAKSEYVGSSLRISGAELHKLKLIERWDCWLYKEFFGVECERS